jgi:hypothetical protein
MGAILAVAAAHVFSGSISAGLASGGAILAAAEHALSALVPRLQDTQRLRWYAEDLLVLLEDTRVHAETLPNLVPYHLLDRELAPTLHKFAG